MAHRIALLVTAFLLVACMHSRWSVVRQEAPNPFSTQTTFAIEPIHFEAMTVSGGTEAQFLTTKNDDLKNLWQSDKKEMSATYVERMSTDPFVHAMVITPEKPADPKAYVLRLSITQLEPGSFAGVVVEATDVRATLQVLAPGSGKVLDEIRLRASVPAGATSPSTGGRLRSAASELARQTSEYIASRVR